MMEGEIFSLNSLGGKHEGRTELDKLMGGLEQQSRCGNKCLC